MPKATDFCNDFLALILNATAIADLAMNDSTSPLTALFVSLHSASPGTGGSQTTNEIVYGGYARQSVPRTTAGWTVPALKQSKNVARIVYPVCVSGSATATHVAIGTLVAGVGRVLYAGQLAAGRLIVAGVIPVFIEEALLVSEA